MSPKNTSVVYLGFRKSLLLVIELGKSNKLSEEFKVEFMSVSALFLSTAT